MPAKLTQEQFLKQANSLHGERFCYRKSQYVSRHTPLTVTCVVHGDFITTPANHLRGKGGCTKCTGGIPLTTEIFIQRSNEAHGSIYDYSLVRYVNHGTKVKIFCTEHGEFEQVPEYHLSGNGCPKCSGRVQYYGSDFVTKANEIHLNKPYSYSMIPEVFKSKTILTITCAFHGDFTTNYERFIRRSNGCRGCSGHAKSNTYNFVEKATRVHDGYYSYSNVVYNTCEDYVLVTCKKHGDFKITANNHLNGKGCPKCVHQISSQEDKLSEAFPQFSRTNRSAIAPYHLDLYSEKHKLAIEVNGRYWHSESRGKDRNYHLNKTNLCQKQGITLLHFWDDEVDTKLEIVKSMISSRLNVNKKVYARKCEVRKITLQETKEFLTTNHLQGYTRSSENYGLFQNDEIFAVMTFGKPRFDKNAQWEIIRFANKLNTTVVGGASRLLKAFVADNLPNSIITYADRRYSEGNLYEQLGFKFSHNAVPSYFYCKGSVSLPRYKAQKHKLSALLGDGFDPEKSETQNMLDNGYYKVYDCGNKVFTWSNK